MTLDQAFQQYQGVSIQIGSDVADKGQCVMWADTVLHDVYGLPYHYGNAIDWWNKPEELLGQFDKLIDGTIKKGDFVIFNQKVGSQYGHIDVAMSDGSYSNFQGADSNWGGNLTVHLVQHSNPSFILGTLRLKEEAAVLNDGDVINLYQGMLGRAPSPDEIKIYENKDWKTVVYAFLSSDEFKARLAGHSINKGDVINWITGNTK